MIYNITMETEKRSKEFWEEYKNLIEKHQMDILPYPQFIPDNEGGWKLVVRMQLFDKRDESFVAKNEAPKKNS